MKKLTLLIGITCLPLSVSYGLTCGICKQAGKRFSCRKMEHMVIHLAYVHKLWSCPHCPKRIQGYQTYKEHVHDAHGRRTCSRCVTCTFESEEAYRLHADAIHFPSETYRWFCGDCKTRFSTLERFVIHAILKHKQYACWYCIGEIEKGTQSQINGYGNKKGEFLEHMKDKHGKLICTECNMRVFDLKEKEAHENHIKEDNHKPRNITELCKFCNRMYAFRYKAEAELHNLQHAPFLLFLERTIPGHKCCIQHRTFILRARYKGLETEEKWHKAKINFIREFYLHVLAEHKCCLFCENPVTDTFRKALKQTLQTLESITYQQIASVARMFIRLDENTFAKGEVPAIHCDICGSALYPNRKSRLFFASIKEFPFGKGLDRQDYPFHHLEYDERKAEKNTMMSVIKEVPANEEKSRFIPKKEEKDDIILGEEDEAEDEECDEEEEEDKKEEDKKEEEKEEGKEKPKTDK